jgi:hypothetical protein
MAGGVLLVDTDVSKELPASVYRVGIGSQYIQPKRRFQPTRLLYSSKLY